MRLDEVLNGVRVLEHSGDMGCDITGMAYDSRKVKQGHLFVAVAGEKVDGRDFIGQALMKGAAAILYQSREMRTALSEEEKASRACFVRVNDSRAALARASNNFFGNPSGKLAVIGITGTNGKTTTTYLMKSILESWGKKVGLIGTIQYMIGDQVFEAPHTTPESLEFQELLHEMHASGCTHVISEVSSHALAQKRVDGTVFQAAVFTNLTRDHLDFHKTMEDYYRAKSRLFMELLTDKTVSVINYDDPWGRRLLADLKGGSCTYGLEAGSDVMAAEINNSSGGLNFVVVKHGQRYAVASPLLGLPNVYNILAAVGASLALGVPWNMILEGIGKAADIMGRFEKVDVGQGFLAVIDYAHTEDALERLIYTARGLTRRRIITVFGCGGDRDKGKRPVMGAIATRLSDFVIITSDNPRSEKPEAIIEEVAAGAVRRNYLIEPDRGQAIKRAVRLAEDGDIILVAGKGHERYQEINGARLAFSDREVLENTIRQLITNG